MTATDRLRELLDERGVEWEALSDQQEGDFTITATRWHDSEGGLLTMFISEPHGSTWDFFWLPTPEQAIAATLGAVEYRKPTTLSQLEAENAKLRERNTTQKQTIQAYRDESREWREVAERAQAENAKLREKVQRQADELTSLRKAIEQRNGEWRPWKRQAERFVAENAKLRELVRDLYCLAYPSAVEWEVSDETYDKYSPCEKCHELHGGKSPCASTAKDMTEECCAPIQANVVADRMRDLGIEAGE